MMSSPYLTAVGHQLIWDRHREGMNPVEIALATGRSYHTVASLIKSHGGIRPPARTRSELRLSLAEREEISRGLRGRETYETIAVRIGRATSTVSREVARNGGRTLYRAHRADKTADVRALRPKAAKLSFDPALREVVTGKLEAKWAPQQIASWLRLTYPDNPTMWISAETIYVSVFRRVDGLKPGLHQCLRTGRIRRRPRRRGRGEKRGKNPDMILITHRPAEVEDRVQPGHWEGDLIYGSGHRRAIGTLVERTSRYLILLEPARRDRHRPHAPSTRRPPVEVARRVAADPHLGPRHRSVRSPSVHRRLRRPGVLLSRSQPEHSPISDDDLSAARAFADVATIAILQHQASADAQTLNEQLTHALTARITVEQAKGILAERADVDIDAAFAWLLRHARHHNLRLITLAQQVIDGTVTLDTIEKSRPTPST